MEAAADHQQQQLISDEWSTEVEKLLTATQKAPAGRARTRLPKAMMNAKPEAYTPQLLSLGPYHHRTLKDESVGPYHHRFTHLSQMENYKINGARDTANNNPNLIKEFFQKISEPGMLSRLEEFYDWKVDKKDAQKFVWMMTVDALFLYYFLKSGFNGDAEESSDIMPAMASVRCDIVKLENQIPFFLLREVEKYLKTKNENEQHLLSRIATLSSFQVRDDLSVKLKVEEEQHLLGCIHKYVSSFLEIEKDPADGTQPTMCQKIRTALGDMIAAVCGIFFRHPALSGRPDFLDKYNAEDLAKAGFSFKSFQGPGKIRFDRYSDTLFLPQIIISDPYTELMLRNLLALEFNGPQKHVTEYVELMDCLIDTQEDVALLRDCHVIVRQSMMISDKYVATMWDGMCKPFFSRGLLEPPLGLKSQITEVLIKNYYKSKIKSMFREFREQYLAKPWQVVALLVGIIVVVMDTMQTYCSFTDCQSKSGTKDNGTVGGRKHLGTFG